jgi:hypothetical protein
MCGREGLKIKITEYVIARNEAIPAQDNQEPGSQWRPCIGLQVTTKLFIPMQHGAEIASKPSASSQPRNDGVGGCDFLLLLN